ncbi:serine hydrolase [Amycolatopsis antarctica]|uniref:Serine hydrolase n=1 Tax=Amycolatopsis antarctica TaxID=1854586 RepID=A0A263D4U7_9PSEU|nr:serine hydrolase [Amycolatopsis antarctica]OZM73463.1 serine hydrolase [Amycolatopsis antarctica]
MRSRVTALIAIAAVVLTGTGAGATAAPGEQGGHDGTGRFDRPQQGFAPAATELRDGAPEDVGLDPAPIRAAEQQLTAWTQPDPATGHPLFAGAVGLLAHDGTVVDTFTTGSAVRYADAEGTELPPEQQVPMRADTIFDMASISKLFTSIAVMQLVEQGGIDVEAPVATYLPEFGVNGKEAITVKQLLTHTSGLEPFLNLWKDWPDKPSRIKAVMDVAPKTPPGSAYEYSDLNLITLGLMVERLTGSPLDAVVAERITGPLGMPDTGYNPPAEKLDRIAATEFTSDPPRGLVRGEVHDENAWSLGGVAGHAGVFSTARDITVLGQAILNGGTYGGQRILGEEAVRSMLTNYNQQFPEDSHGLGFELNQMWYMGALTSPVSAGHTGFTGTTLVIDPLSRSVAVLLTNRVHPTRDWGSVNPARQAWATGLARAMAVRPRHGEDAWFTGIGNAATSTLTTKPLTVQGDARIEFSAFVDSEPTDTLVLEASRDGANWTPVPVTASGAGSPESEVDALSGTGHRQWWKVDARLQGETLSALGATSDTTGVTPQEQVTLRWRYTTDTNYTGRGIHVDGISVTGSNGTILDGERDTAAFTGVDWQLQGR